MAEKQQFMWTFEEDAECWYNGPLDSIEDCVKDAKESLQTTDEAYEKVYVAEAKLVQFYVDADCVIERVAEWLDEEVGEVSGDWPSASRNEIEDLSKRLTECLIKWEEDNNIDRNFYTIENVKSIPINK